MHFLSNYCGLGGSGPVQHALDVLCKKHDEEYQDMIESGRNPYIRYNNADRRFLNALKRIKPGGVREMILHKASYAFFRLKGLVVPDLKTTPHMTNHLRADKIDDISEFTPKDTMARLDILNANKRQRRDSTSDEASSPEMRDEGLQSGGVPMLELPSPLDFGPNKDSASEPTGETGAMDMELDTARVSSGGSGGNPFGHETRPTLNGKISYGLPNTQTVRLKRTFCFDANQLNNTNEIYKMIIRMNTPNDIIKFPALPVHTVSLKGLSQSQWARPTAQSIPMSSRYFKFYAKMYDYYTVLGTEWKLRIKNKDDAIANQQVGRVLAMYIGTVEPPTPQGTVTANTVKDIADITYFKGIKRDVLCYPSDTSGEKTVVTIGDYHRHQENIHEIKQDSESKIWTATNASPSYNDNLCLIFAGDTFSAGGVNLECELSVEYITQFKEIKEKLVYPIPADDKGDPNFPIFSFFNF